MDREILFRAKELHKDEWVYGVPLNFLRNTFETDEWLMVTECNVDELDYWIPDFSTSLIESETICQYTGLLDKNGQKIFEGDVVLCVYDGQEFLYVVIWDNDELDFKATNGKENYGKNFEYLGCCEEIEVVGNIFDNPELLEVVE